MPAYAVALDVVCGDAIADCDPVNVRQFLSGRIINASGGDLVLTMYECDTVGGTYVVAADAGTAGDVSITNNQSAALPTVLSRANYLKFLRDAGDDATVRLLLKD